VTTLDARFSVPDARPTPWPEARHQLGEAGAYITEELAVQSARQAYLEAPLVRAR
jgi:hypothetical protein